MATPITTRCRCGRLITLRLTFGCACGCVTRREDVIKDSAERMIDKHRPSFDKLADADTPQANGGE